MKWYGDRCMFIVGIQKVYTGCVTELYRARFKYNLESEIVFIFIIIFIILKINILNQTDFIC